MNIARNGWGCNMLVLLICSSLLIASHVFVMAAVGEGGESGVKLLGSALLLNLILLMVVAKGVSC